MLISLRGFTTLLLSGLFLTSPQAFADGSKPLGQSITIAPNSGTTKTKRKKRKKRPKKRKASVTIQGNQHTRHVQGLKRKAKKHKGKKRGAIKITENKGVKSLPTGIKKRNRSGTKGSIRIQSNGKTTEQSLQGIAPQRSGSVTISENKGVKSLPTGIKKRNRSSTKGSIRIQSNGKTTEQSLEGIAPQRSSSVTISENKGVKSLPTGIKQRNTSRTKGSLRIRSNQQRSEQSMNGVAPKGSSSVKIIGNPTPTSTQKRRKNKTKKDSSKRSKRKSRK